MLRGGIKLPFKLLGIPVKLDHSFLLILPLFAFLIGSQLPAFVTQLRLVGIVVPPGDLTEGATPWVLGAIEAFGPDLHAGCPSVSGHCRIDLARPRVDAALDVEDPREARAHEHRLEVL